MKKTDVMIELDEADIENPVAWFAAFAVQYGLTVKEVDDEKFAIDLTPSSDLMNVSCEIQWDEECETLYLAGVDKKLKKMMDSPTIYQTLNKVNRNTAVGYFTMNAEGLIVWRYSILFRGTTHLYENFFEDVLQGVVSEFERFQPIFSLASDDRPIANDMFDHVIQPPVGEA